MLRFGVLVTKFECVERRLYIAFLSAYDGTCGEWRGVFILRF